MKQQAGNGVFICHPNYFTLQVIICIKLISRQTEITLRQVKEDATIVGVEPFYNQTTFCFD